MAVLLLLFYATASGYSAMIATKLEQLMCSQVKSNNACGLFYARIKIAKHILRVVFGFTQIYFIVIRAIPTPYLDWRHQTWFFVVLHLLYQ